MYEFMSVYACVCVCMCCLCVCLYMCVYVVFVCVCVCACVFVYVCVHVCVCVCLGMCVFMQPLHVCGKPKHITENLNYWAKKYYYSVCLFQIHASNKPKDVEIRKVMYKLFSTDGTKPSQEVQLNYYYNAYGVT